MLVCLLGSFHNITFPQMNLKQNPFRELSFLTFSRIHPFQELSFQILSFSGIVFSDLIPYPFQELSFQTLSFSGIVFSDLIPYPFQELSFQTIPFRYVTSRFFFKYVSDPFFFPHSQATQLCFLLGVLLFRRLCPWCDMIQHIFKAPVSALEGS